MRRGILMVVANVGGGDEAEFNRWYDCEHIRERVAIPGFLSAQRYVSTSDSRWKYLALYETESLQTLRSPAYLEALANQTELSKSILARFRDPQRSVGERTCTAGYGTGGVVSIARIRPKPGMGAALRRALSAEILPQLVRQEGAIRASLVECDPALSRPVAEHPKGGLDVIRPDDWLLTVDAAGAEPARFDAAALAGAEPVETLEPIGTFRLLWDLHRSDLEGAP